MIFAPRALRRALLAGAAVAGLPAAAAAADPMDSNDTRVVSPVEIHGHALAEDTPLSTRTVHAEQITRAVNAVTVEDALKYQPSILVRRRHIGDTQAPISTRTSGVGASARSLIYADGVLLSALIGNNNSTASPRWGMVAPSEVDHIDVRYGPFSAAFPGNSIGAVIEIATRTQASPAAAVHQPGLSAARASPKAVLAWMPDGDWSMTASAGLAYRFPTVSELYQAVTVGTQVFVPNPNLAPERALSTELSAARRFGWGHAQLSVFTEDVSKALISQSAPIAPNSATLASFVQNVPRVRARGAEAELEAHDLLPRLDLTASVTYVDSTVRSDRAFPAAQGKRTPQVPQVRWTAVATWRATDRLTLTAAARYSDRVFATIDNADRITHTFQGFEDYLVIDARAVWTFDPHWSAAVGVDNATNDKYFIFHPFPQRSVLAELKYGF